MASASCSLIVCSSNSGDLPCEFIVGGDGCADGTVAVFGDDQFHRLVVFLSHVVVGVPVEEDDDVGVFFDGAGFAQVGHERAFVVPLFDGAAELGECDDGAVEFARHCFQVFRDLGYLQMHAAAFILRMDEGQVVDENDGFPVRMRMDHLADVHVDFRDCLFAAVEEVNVRFREPADCTRPFRFLFFIKHRVGIAHAQS